MIIFNTAINFIESLLFVWFIAEFFDFKDNKNKFIFVSTLQQFIVLEISQIINYYGIFLSFIIMIVIIISIYIHDILLIIVFVLKMTMNTVTILKKSKSLDL